ncbi:MAG TPA: hypothetical protein VL899_11460 [Alphaproteobacteria bacterium]|jgi:hypothetical protein|nr:hypothetical protein [Alphaproteobacteria bacterium]
MFIRDLERRGFLMLGAGLACSLGGAAMGEESCAKPYAGDKEQRDSLHYVEQSSDAERACTACQYFEPRGRCGNCRILETMVNPAGTCDSFSKKAD